MNYADVAGFPRLGDFWKTVPSKRLEGLEDELAEKTREVKKRKNEVKKTNSDLRAQQRQAQLEANRLIVEAEGASKSAVRAERRELSTVEKKDRR